MASISFKEHYRLVAAWPVSEISFSHYIFEIGKDYTLCCHQKHFWISKKHPACFFLQALWEVLIYSPKIGLIMSYKVPMKVTEMQLTYNNKIKAVDRPRDTYRVLESNWSSQIGLLE